MFDKGIRTGGCGSKNLCFTILTILGWGSLLGETLPVGSLLSGSSGHLSYAVNKSYRTFQKIQRFIDFGPSSSETLEFFFVSEIWHFCDCRTLSIYKFLINNTGICLFTVS